MVQDYCAWKGLRSRRLPRQGFFNFHGLLCNSCKRPVATVFSKPNQLYGSRRSRQPTREVRFQHSPLCYIRHDLDYVVCEPRVDCPPVLADVNSSFSRYLLVKGAHYDTVDSTMSSTGPQQSPGAAVTSPPSPMDRVPLVELDPQHRTTVNTKPVEIPDPHFQVQALLDARRRDRTDTEPDEVDSQVFQYIEPESTKGKGKGKERGHGDAMGVDDDDYQYYASRQPASSKSLALPTRPKDDWKHDAEAVRAHVESLFLPPMESTPSASLAIQREMKAMLKEQHEAPSLRDLGWYMPEEFIGDNLYQWIVEMHSLDETLPIAKDMKKQCVFYLYLSFPLTEHVLPIVMSNPSYLRLDFPRRFRTHLRFSEL